MVSIERLLIRAIELMKSSQKTPGRSFSAPHTQVLGQLQRLVGMSFSLVKTAYLTKESAYLVQPSQLTLLLADLKIYLQCFFIL